MNEMCRKYRLSINGEKTKVMVFERVMDDTECKVSLNGSKLDQVNEFVYLGSMFDRGNKIDDEIGRRVNSALKVITALSGFHRTDGLSKRARLVVYDGVVMPTLMYGSETWVLQNKHKSRLCAAEMHYLEEFVLRPGWTILEIR